MGLLDEPFRNLANVLTSVLGGTCTLKRPVTSGYNPETDVYSTATQTSYSGVPLTPPQDAHKTTDEGLVVQDGLKAYVPALYLTENSIPDPEVGWSVVIGSTTYRINEVGRVMSGDSVALWILRVSA